MSSFSPQYCPVFDVFLPYYNRGPRARFFALPGALCLPLEIALDLETIFLVLFLFHHDPLMVEIKMYRRAQLGIAGQAEKLLHPLFLLWHIEQVADALFLTAWRGGAGGYRQAFSGYRPAVRGSRFPDAAAGGWPSAG